MPRGRNPRYVDQVLVIVKESGYILQKEVAKMFNMKYSSGLENSVKRLIDKNRIKRTKIKIRYKNGNLNEAWLLYMPTTDYNLILEYEKTLINKPFESPLKEHHCYKKNVETVENVNVIDKGNANSNVIDMSEYIRVNDTDLSIKEFNGYRVITFNDIDTVHKRNKGTASRNFRENREHFQEGKHYFSLTPKDFQLDEIRRFGINSPKGGYLITERGYLLLVKSFTDKLSWAIQEQLADSYFTIQELKSNPETEKLPQIHNQSLDIMEMMIREMKKDRDRVDQIENKLNKIVSILSN